MEFNELMEKVSQVEMEYSNKEEWDKGYELNEDPYGRRCFTYARDWARLMQIEMANGVELKDCADKTSSDADYDGITGFMFGMAVSILSKTWKYGEQLRLWHNSKYNHQGNGVVNPAIITLGGN
jgi:hypothetical protein